MGREVRLQERRGFLQSAQLAGQGLSSCPTLHLLAQLRGQEVERPGLLGLKHRADQSSSRFSVSFLRPSFGFCGSRSFYRSSSLPGSSNGASQIWISIIIGRLDKQRDRASFLSCIPACSGFASHLVLYNSPHVTGPWAAFKVSPSDKVSHS